MYLAVLHVQRSDGAEGRQAYLHLHGAAFPVNDPLSVPLRHPGPVVLTHLEMRPGGNRVLSYLDIIAPDGIWMAEPPYEPEPPTTTEWWQQRFEPIGDLLLGRPLPWVVTVGDARVVFNASSYMPAVSEYEYLLGAALDLWEEWRTPHGLP